MAGNTFGKIFKLSTFGESHGAAIGGIVDGCPAGMPLSVEEIQQELDLRRPGSGMAGTKRQEADRIEILSGLFEGRTTGTPMGFVIANTNQHSGDYTHLANIFRPGHADWTWHCKCHGVRDYRGGGRASGRETACRVAGGAVAKKLLSLACNAEIFAAAIELGGIAIPDEEKDLAHAQSRPFFAANHKIVPQWENAVTAARKEGDTLGGIVEIVATNIPTGLGEPVFDRLDAVLAHAIMSVGAVKGIEIGTGFAASRLHGSENNDPMTPGNPHFTSNHAGGILGGISSGQDIVIRAAVKPIASIARPQHTINTDGGEEIVTIGGRHDLSAIPRIVPVLSAMTALALADALLLQKRMELFCETR